MPSVSKGSEREAFVRDFLQLVFPSPFRFGSGAVIDSDGNSSGQIDIVVEYLFLPSFPMPGGTDRLYLAESVAVALEVKSNVSTQWKEVEHSAASMRKVSVVGAVRQQFVATPSHSARVELLRFRTSRLGTLGTGNLSL